MRIVIIGAGPTGLGAAHRLQELGHDDFLVVDRAPYFGGLATSFVDEKGFTWDFAVHVAHSHYRYVDALMDQLLPDGFYHHQRASWVREYGRFIPYPFQNNIRHLPGDALWDCVNGLLEIQHQGASVPPENFEEWILGIFGQGIADHFMLPYNRKVWCTDPRDMGYQWIGDRVPTVDMERVVRNICTEQDDVGWGPNSTFQFPKEGGTGAIWKKLGESLPQEKVRLRCPVVGLDVKAKTITLDDGTVEPYDHLISTIPLKVLAPMTGLSHLEALAGRLKHTHVQVAGIAPSMPLPKQLDDKTWMYVPEEEAVFYRVTPFSQFSPTHVPDPENQCSILCEISTPGDGEVLEGDLGARAIEDLRKTGIIDADPATTHCYMMETEYGYPIPTIDRDEILAELLPGLEAHQIYSRGRFGGWKYEVANMDHSLMQGVECVNRLLEGGDEPTLNDPATVNSPENKDR